jgi:hypothetical protein
MQHTEKEKGTMQELKALHDQSDFCVGHAAFTVIWPLRSYFLCFAEQHRAVE